MEIDLESEGRLMAGEKEEGSKPSLWARLGEHALEKFIGAIALAFAALLVGNYLEIWNASYCWLPWSDNLVCGR